MGAVAGVLLILALFIAPQVWIVYWLYIHPGRR